MSDVFVSYAREDQRLAARLVQALEARGLSVWWDQHLAAGSRHREEALSAVNKARAVAVLWSKHSVVSDWVPGEAKHGARRRVLFPARLDDSEIPLDFEGFHTVDLSVWDGQPSHQVFERFLEDIVSSLGRIPVTEIAAPSGIDHFGGTRNRGPFRLLVVLVLGLLLVLVSRTWIKSFDKPRLQPGASTKEHQESASEGDLQVTEPEILKEGEADSDDGRAKIPVTSCLLSPTRSSCELGHWPYRIRATFFEDPPSRAVLRIYERAQELASESLRAGGEGTIRFQDLRGQDRHLLVGFQAASRQVEVELGGH